MQQDVLQRRRLLARSLFFAAFLLAPALDIFRFDLYRGNFILLGIDLTLGLNTDWILQSSPTEVAWRLLSRVILPAIVLVATGILIFRRWGRLYCGWLCPHFSVVELINGLMLRILGKPTLWEKGPIRATHPLSWGVIVGTAMTLGALWAVGLLSYLVPPLPLYQNILAGDTSRNETLFLCVATLVFTLDFLLARHLFCRYGCAFGLIQSLIWMGNRRAAVVRFDRKRAELCRGCDKDCESACPMRLQVRSIKRAKFTCTQCMQCVSACSQVQKNNPDGSLLGWVEGDEAAKVARGAPRHIIPMVAAEEPTTDQNATPPSAPLMETREWKNT